MSKLAVAVVPVTPFRQNCTLIWDDETLHGVVVDPGGDAPQIAAAIARQKLTVEAIWLTHGHLDHAGGAAELRELLGGTLPIVGPTEADRFLLEGIAEQAAQYSLKGLRSVTPDRWLVEGEVLALGTHRFEVLHCPGHTPGHVVFVDKAAGFAQLGDVLFAGSVGRTDFAYSDPDLLIRSIKDKLLPLGDAVQFICGHGPGSSIGRERANNPFLN